MSNPKRLETVVNIKNNTSKIVPVINNKNDAESSKMIEQSAVVLSTEGGYAYVKPEVKGTCGGCANKQSGCSTLSLSSFFGASQIEKVKVQNLVYARPGDHVIIGVQGNAFLVYSMLAYMLPLISMLIFAVLGMEVFELMGLNPEVGAFFSAIGGILAGLRLGNRLASLSQHFEDFKPVVLRKQAAEAHPLVNFGVISSKY